MSKKTLILLIVVGAAVVLAIGIFMLFFTAPKTDNTVRVLSPNSPFGNYSGSASTTPISPTPTPDNQPNGEITDYINNPSSPLIKISTQPIAGAEVFDRKTSATTTTSIVRYIERATGHTIEYDRTTNRLDTSSNTTIAGIYQAFWSGNTVLAQFLDSGNIKTFSGNLPAIATSTGQLTGNFLPLNIYSLAISPKGNRLFSITTGDSAIGNISNLDGSKSSTIFKFPLNEWETEWPNENTLTLTTKPAAGVPGYMYFVSTTGSMTKAVGNLSGLTSRTSPNLGYAILSASMDGGIATAVHDFSKNVDLAFTNSPTLAEKCVWSKTSKVAYCAIPQNVPIGNYPDDWYKGSVSFIDNIYKVDLSLPAVQLIYKLPANQYIDAINLFLDAKEENLYFTNKNDYFLWGLNIKDLQPIGQ